MAIELLQTNIDTIDDDIYETKNDAFGYYIKKKKKDEEAYIKLLRKIGGYYGCPCWGKQCNKHYFGCFQIICILYHIGNITGVFWIMIHSIKHTNDDFCMPMNLNILSFQFESLLLYLLGLCSLGGKYHKFGDALNETHRLSDERIMKGTQCSTRCNKIRVAMLAVAIIIVSVSGYFTFIDTDNWLFCDLFHDHGCKLYEILWDVADVYRYAQCGIIILILFGIYIYIYIICTYTYIFTTSNHIYI